MSNTKFTPGPWEVGKKTKSLGGLKFYGPDEELGIVHTSIPQYEANAKLISAAPDMFEVIKEVYEWAIQQKVVGSIFPKLEAAYKKATE